MNSMEFVHEVMQSEIAPERFEEKYKVFQEYQKLALDTLKAFHNVCKDNKIPYELAFGSLLGAIRDGGQIPWDYDIDVFVRATDRVFLIEALKKSLNKDYFVYTVETNKECIHVISRIAPRGYDSRYLHVDIFYVMGLSNDVQIAEKQRKAAYSIAMEFKAKQYNPFSYGHITKHDLMRVFKYRLKSFIKSKRKVWMEYEDLSMQEEIDKVDYCCPADRFSDYVYPSSMMKEIELYHMEIGDFYIPTDYDKILKLTFGDYHSVPSLENRIKEMMGSYESLIKHCPLKY